MHKSIETGKAYHYCPGCTHTVIHKQIASLIVELGIQEKAIGIAPVGCSVLAYDYIDIDWVEVAHGRAPAAATGIKSVIPDSVVICYQGDGDLASIGLAETIHTAARGINLTVIFINNGTYGMTGGQMAPTTLLGTRTSTTPSGRASQFHGHPIKVAEIINELEMPYMIARCHAADKNGVIDTKNLIREGLINQIDKKGYSFIEILSTCPTNWKMTTLESLNFIKEQATGYFKTGYLRKDGKTVC